MVDYVVTAKVDSHHTAKRYQCLLIDLRNEPTFHFEIVNGRLMKADLMPTDQFVLDLCHHLSKQSPTFRRQLQDLVFSLDFQEITDNKPRGKARTVIDFM